MINIIPGLKFSGEYYRKVEVDQYGNEEKPLTGWRKFSLDWKTLKDKKRIDAFLQFPHREGTNKNQYWVFSGDQYLHIALDQNNNDSAPDGSKLEFPQRCQSHRYFHTSAGPGKHVLGLQRELGGDKAVFHTTFYGSLRRAFPRVRVRMCDFYTIRFKDELKIASSTVRGSFIARPMTDL